jgi:hypothetical protein
MTANEYTQATLEAKTEITLSPSQTTDEAATYEAAQLISGSFTYLLYEALWMNFFDMVAITQHLESLYDSANHFGLVYFIIILTNAVEFSVPVQFTEMSANDVLVPILSAAIIEDWLDYNATCEVEVVESE